MSYKKITFVLPSTNDNRVAKLVIAGNNEFRLHGGAELDKKLQKRGASPQF